MWVRNRLLSRTVLGTFSSTAATSRPVGLVGGDRLGGGRWSRRTLLSVASDSSLLASSCLLRLLYMQTISGRQASCSCSATISTPSSQCTWLTILQCGIETASRQPHAAATSVLAAPESGRCIPPSSMHSKTPPVSVFLVSQLLYVQLEYHEAVRQGRWRATVGVLTLVHPR